MIFALILLCAAVLNHIRGGGGLFRISWLIDKVPGRPLYWVSLLIGLLALPVMPWQYATAFGVGYLIWGSAEWGRWFSLGHMPRGANGKPPSWFAVLIEDVAGPNDYVAFTLRNVLMLLPLSLIFPVMLAFGPLQTGAYAMGWRLAPDNGIGVSELLTGSLWGVAIIVCGALV